MESYMDSSTAPGKYPYNSRDPPPESDGRTGIPYIDLSADLLNSSLNRDLSSLISHTDFSQSASGGTLAKKIFGQLLAEQRLTGKHLAHLLTERWKLYVDHTSELREEISRMKNRLAFASRPYTVTNPQLASSLEKLLLKLEADERKEEIDFWKDSVEIRDKLLEASNEYRRTSDRGRIVGEAEVKSE